MSNESSLSITLTPSGTLRASWMSKGKMCCSTVSTGAEFIEQRVCSGHVGSLNSMELASVGA